MGAGESGAAPFGQTRRELASDATPSHHWEWYRRGGSPPGRSTNAISHRVEYFLIPGTEGALLCAMDRS